MVCHWGIILQHGQNQVAIIDIPLLSPWSLLFKNIHFWDKKGTEWCLHVYKYTVLQFLKDFSITSLTVISPLHKQVLLLIFYIYQVTEKWSGTGTQAFSS